MTRKINYLLILSVLMLTIGIGKASAQSQAIEDHFKAINSHDVKAVAAGYAPGAQIFSPNWEGAKMGTDGVNDIYTRYFKSTHDLVYEVKNIIQGSNAIVVE